MVFELDATETLARKKACLEKAGTLVPDGVVMASIDFDKQSLTDALQRSGYSDDKMTLFIWEGVSYYLSPAAVDHVLDLVKRNRRPRSRIAFDYAVALDDENIDRFHGARAFVETWKKRRSGEPFEFTIEEGTLPSFLQERGLELMEHKDTEEIERSYLGRGDGHASGFFRLAVAARSRHNG